MHMLELFVILIAVAVAAPRYGVDSRSSAGYRRPATPVGDLAVLARRLRVTVSSHRR